MKYSLNTTIKTLVPVVIGTVVAFILFHKEFNLEALSEVDFNRKFFTGIAIALLFVAGREYGMSWRYRVLSGNRLKWKAAVKVTMLCEFTSCITPTSVGGSAASAVYMTRYGLTAGRSTSVMLTTLFLDEIFIVAVASLIFCFIPYSTLFNFGNEEMARDLQIGFWIVIAILAIWCGILWIGIFKSPATIKKALIAIFSLPLLRRWRKSIESMGDDIISTSSEIKNAPISLWTLSFAATTISWTCRFLTVSALIWGIGIDTGKLLIFGRQIVVWVLLMFTPTPGGSGMSEWIFKEYYSDIVQSAAAIMVLALTWRLLTYYIYLLAGIPLIPSLTKKK